MVIAEQRWRWRVRVQCWHCGDWHSVAGAWWSKRDVDRIVVRTLKLLEYRNG